MHTRQEDVGVAGDTGTEVFVIPVMYCRKFLEKCGYAGGKGCGGCGSGSVNVDYWNVLS